MIVSLQHLIPAKPNTNQIADIILSLTRTSRPGYIRDLRRLTVALSRARLGLYILGRRSVFESVYELQAAFEKLFERPDQLALVTNELYGSVRRSVDDEVDSTPMVNLEHLGQYVFEMTKAKVAALKAGEEVLPTVREEVGAAEESDVDEAVDDDEAEEEDEDEV
jgi:intron-binding protein aquarius